MSDHRSLAPPDRERLPQPETPKIEDQSRSCDTTSEEETYLILTDVKVKGSYLPTGSRSTSSSALNMVKQGTMTATTSSGMNGTGTLSTSLIGEDAGEVGRHVDDGSGDGEFR